MIGDFNNPLPIEVKYSSGFDWQDRKYSGIKLFLRRFPRTREALIISKDFESEMKEQNTAVKILPLWKLLRK